MVGKKTPGGPKVMVVLESHVVPDQWTALQEGFKADMSRLPSQIVQAFLAQSATDPTFWRAVSIWHSSEALQEYRSSVETPAGISLFRSLGADLQISIYEIMSEHDHGQE
jgi:hypothetical protein